MKKRILAILLSAVMALSMVACGGAKEEAPAVTDTPAVEEEVAVEEEATDAAAATEITLWTYPIGNWGDQATLDALLADFEASTGIKVKVDFLTYADGDGRSGTSCS